MEHRIDPRCLHNGGHKWDGNACEVCGAPRKPDRIWADFTALEMRVLASMTTEDFNREYLCDFSRSRPKYRVHVLCSTPVGYEAWQDLQSLKQAVPGTLEPRIENEPWQAGAHCVVRFLPAFDTHEFDRNRR